MNPHLLHARRLSLLILSVLLLGLAACSGLRLVDNEVSSFARWSGSPAGPGATYRFERLPSQQLAGPDVGQDDLEAMAQAALAKLGLVHYPDAALLVVQLSATTVVQPGYSGAWPPFPSVTVGAGTAGRQIGVMVPMMRYEPPLYIREVQIILRDSRSHAVVYETRARHSGLWTDSRALWPAMLDAALSGFPNPPAGLRKVDVQIPR